MATQWQDRGALNIAPSQPAKKKQKGFWEDQISAGGSLAGALAGGAAGTAIMPGVGTLLGALAGGLFGGGGGQMLENKVTGEQNLLKDVGTEALWGGATAIPFGASLKLAKAGGTLAKGLGSTTARQGAMNLVQEAGIKTMGKKALGNATLAGTLSEGAQAAAERVAKAPTLAQRLGGKLSGTADDFAVKQFRLTPTQLANYNKKFGEDAGHTIRKYGFTSAEDIATKGIDPLQKQFGDLVDGAGSISTDTLKNNFKSAIAKLADGNSSTNRAMAESLQAEVNGLLGKYGASIPASQVNAIRREFDSLVNYTAKAADPNKYGVNKRVADTLRKTLQEADPTGQLKSVGNEISKLRQLSDVVAKQGELGRGSLPLNLTGLLGASVGGGALGGVPGAAGGAILTQALNSAGGRKATMGAINAATSKLASQTPKALGQTFPQVAARIGGIGAARSLATDNSGDFAQSPSDLNNTPAMNTTSTINAPDMNANMDSPYTQPEQPSSPLGYSSTQIAQALMKAYAAGDTAAVKQLSGMYELASTFEQSSAGSGLSSSAATQVASNSNAFNTLNQLEGLYADAGSGSGKIAGTLANALASAGMNGNVQTYNDLSASSVSQLARALNGGGQVSDADAAVVIQALPKITDSPEVAAKKFAALKARLENARQNTMLYSGGAQEPSATQY